MPTIPNQDEVEIDELVLSAVQKSSEPVALGALLKALHESVEDNKAVDDVEVRHALWRLIDEGRVRLDSKLLISPLQA